MACPSAGEPVYWVTVRTRRFPLHRARNGHSGASAQPRENEERQLRLGLDQLLRYSHLLRKRAEYVIPVLVPELKPRDLEWGPLCKALNVKLVFPPDFEA